MSVFLKLVGALLMVVGIGLGVYMFTKPGVLDAVGIRLDTAALLFIGGLLATGQSGIMAALRGQHHVAAEPAVAANAIQVVGAAVVPPEVSPVVFGRKPEVTNIGTVAAVSAVGAGLAAVAAKASTKDPVAETISALEQAKADVIKSIGGMDAAAHAPANYLTKHEAAAVVHAPEPAAIDEETADEDGLYVLEEKVVRGRPARILSDDTVEAETEEGWMRFENMEHLNEYLDSVEEQSA